MRTRKLYFPNNIYLSPPIPRYTGFGLYFTIYYRGPIPRQIVRLILGCVLFTNSLTYFYTYRCPFSPSFTFITHGQHMAHLWDTALTVEPTITKCRIQINCVRGMSKGTSAWTTFNNGYLGACNDEECNAVRYVMWIAEFHESSSLWLQLALVA